MSTKRAEFRALHEREFCILPNASDAGSAVRLAAVGEMFVSLFYNDTAK